MDPNVNLAEQLKLAGRINKCSDSIDEDTWKHRGVAGRCRCVEDAERLAELVEALDGWMSKGGLKPCRWS